MTLEPELMNAILAMDSYNRGYDASIELDGYQLGDAQLMTQIDSTGNTILLDSGVLQGSDEVIGFYALAYSYNGQTIISFRGTDYPEEGQTTNVPLVGDVPNDIYHGWTAGNGNLASEQAKMALV